jgi:hypothetical protein
MALRQFVDEKVHSEGCDHTHRFTAQWAALQGIDWDDLLDILEAHGGFCDCEVVMNLNEEKVLAADRPKYIAEGFTWRLPESFVASPDTLFDKVILCDPTRASNSHALNEERLVPAPQGATPRKRVRKSVHFFVGIHSGLPSEIGVLAAISPITAMAFAHQVRVGAIHELRAFGEREAAFTLSRIANLPPGTPVGTHFMEINDYTGKTEELRVHKVFMR